MTAAEPVQASQAATPTTSVTAAQMALEIAIADEAAAVDALASAESAYRKRHDTDTARAVSDADNGVRLARLRREEATNALADAQTAKHAADRAAAERWCRGLEAQLSASRDRLRTACEAALALVASLPAALDAIIAAHGGHQAAIDEVNRWRRGLGEEPLGAASSLVRIEATLAAKVGAALNRACAERSRPVSTAAHLSHIRDRGGPLFDWLTQWSSHAADAEAQRTVGEWPL